MELAFVEVAKTAGPMVVLVMFFVWQSSLREARLTSRMDTIIDRQENTLTGVIGENTKAWISNAKTLQDVSQAISYCKHADRGDKGDKGERGERAA